MLRPFVQEDMLPYRRLMSICYTYALENPDKPVEADEKALRQRYGIFGEDGTLLSAMTQIPLTCWFEGQRIPLLGIGGVVTDPTSRCGGGVRQLFEEGLPRLYHEGSVFSALYPFSHVFYRKFGYEYAVRRRMVQFIPRDLRKGLHPAASIRRILPEDDDTALRVLYRTWAAGYNLSCDMEDCFREGRAGQPWALKHTYLLSDDSGTPISFWTGKVDKSSGEALLQLERFAWSGKDGMEAMFAMLRGMNELRRVKLIAPPDLPMAYLIEDPYNYQESTECGGMVRVMNVPKALSLLPAPTVPGACVLRVTDEQIAENNGCFRVASDGKRLSVEPVEDAQSDLSCPIGGLSILVTGAQSLHEALLVGLVQQVPGPGADWAKLLFTRRDLYLNRYF